MRIGCVARLQAELISELIGCPSHNDGAIRFKVLEIGGDVISFGEETINRPVRVSDKVIYRGGDVVNQFWHCKHVELKHKGRLSHVKITGLYHSTKPTLQKPVPVRMGLVL